MTSREVTRTLDNARVDLGAMDGYFSDLEAHIEDLEDQIENLEKELEECKQAKSE